MLIAIDIGNTSINLGVFVGKRLLKRFYIPTKEKTYSRFLKKIFARYKITDAIICSVVPEASRILAKDLKRLLPKKSYILGKGIIVPIRNLYRKPLQVGQDRLVNGLAAAEFYGAPVIVVDFGTAITFDVVSKNKEYLGGMILPGLGISLEALAERTALLPKIKLERPKELIGKDTKNSMLSGIIYGFAALADDLSKRIKHEIGKNAKVIGTGGNVGLISSYCKQLSAIDRDLTLKGIALIYEMEAKKKILAPQKFLRHQKI